MGLLRTILFTLCFVGICVPDSTSATSTTSFSSLEEAVLHIRPALISGASVKIGYAITYPGYIEFHLYNSAQKQIWVGTGVKDKGEHFQVLRRDKLTEGEVYTFEFFYKGKRFPGSFSL